MGIGVALRIALVFVEPQLSEDIYRFIWDGRIYAQGIHPLEYTPSQLINQSEYADLLDKTLYDALNSPDYFTISEYVP